MEKFNIHDWQAKQNLTEHTVNFTKDDMATLHNDGKLVKADDDGKDHTYIFKGDLKEQDNFDSRFKDAMSGAGFSDDEQDDIMSRDVGSPFPGTDEVSNGYKAARAFIDEFREITYKQLSNEERDTFSKEMVLHFLDNTTAAAAAKIYFGKKNI
jgi:hypothetical protein